MKPSLLALNFMDYLHGSVLKDKVASASKINITCLATLTRSLFFGTSTVYFHGNPRHFSPVLDKGVMHENRVQIQVEVYLSVMREIFLPEVT